ncbi:MAG: PEGA domain-containing protein, partial [Luminiphilus sp.]
MSDQDRPDRPINKTRELEAVRFEPAAAPTDAARSFRLKPVTVATSIATAFIAYILFFLLTAKSVEIDVRATTTGDIAISGLAVPFGGRFLVRPGNYDLEVSAEGYVPFEGVLEVTSADSQTRSVVLKPLPGILSIDSTPSGAEVLLDGNRIGTTPTTIRDVEAGDVALTLTLERYQPLVIDLAIEGRGREQAIT